MYQQGLGVPQDDGQAEYWWTAAAQHGNPGAQFNLAWMNHLRARYVDARQWYALAVENGFPEAPDEDRAWTPGQGQSLQPSVTVSEADGTLYPAPGYVWASDADDDFQVRWSPGMAHREYPLAVASDTEGKFHPAPGYAWLSDAAGDLRVLWRPGKQHSRQHPHLISSDSEGIFRPAPGYTWVSEADDDPTVVALP